MSSQPFRAEKMAANVFVGAFGLLIALFVVMTIVGLFMGDVHITSGPACGGGSDAYNATMAEGSCE